MKAWLNVQLGWLRWEALCYIALIIAVAMFVGCELGRLL